MRLWHIARRAVRLDYRATGLLGYWAAGLHAASGRLAGSRALHRNSGHPALGKLLLCDGLPRALGGLAPSQHRTLDRRAQQMITAQRDHGADLADAATVGLGEAR